MLDRIHPQLMQNPALQDLGGILAISKGLAEDQVPQFPLGTFCYQVEVGPLCLDGLFADNNILTLHQQHAWCELVAFRVIERHGASQVIDPCNSRIGSTKVDSHGWYESITHGLSRRKAWNCLV